MSKPSLIRFLACSLLFLLCLSACTLSAAPTPSLTPLAVQLQWIHQAEFAGFYVADQNGYYAAEGLSVSLLPAGPGIDNLAPVVDGSAHFCLATAEQLIAARASGKPLRAIAAIFRRSPTVFIALASSGIARPQDFVGKSIRTPDQQVATLHAMMSRVGVQPGQYTEVKNLPTDAAMFASGEVPVWGAYINALLVLVQQKGLQVNIISPDDYGVHFYGDTLIARADFINQNPDLVLRFLRATLKGWSYAIENPEKVGAIVLKYDPQADIAIENKKMLASIPLVNTGEDHIGWMKPEVWAAMEQTLREQGVINSALDVKQMYSMQFLNQVYK